jgi:hypothetical protein
VDFPSNLSVSRVKTHIRVQAAWKDEVSLVKEGKTDFTGKKFICPNPLLSFGSHI